MRTIRGMFLLIGVVCAFVLPRADAQTPAFEMVGEMRVTFAPRNSQTSRSNPTCICIDGDDVAHLVYEDSRTGEFDIFYASVRNDTVSPEVRISRTSTESTFPCIACGGGSVYILWQESAADGNRVEYARLVDGEVVAKTRLSRPDREASCPVAAYDGDGTLHVAWHEGPAYQSGITYGRVVDDSLVHLEEIEVKTPRAFRPDIACDGGGKLVLAWIGKSDIMTRLWDGEAWQEVKIASPFAQRPWRISVAYIEPGRWGIAWFDRTVEGDYPVYAAFYDETEWYGIKKLNERDIGYYPNICAGPGGSLQVVWEGKHEEEGIYSMKMRWHDGDRWRPTQEFLVRRSMARYPSIALDSNGDFRAIWFSDGRGSYEIFYGILRRK